MSPDNSTINFSLHNVAGIPQHDRQTITIATTEKEAIPLCRPVYGLAKNFFA